MACGASRARREARTAGRRLPGRSPLRGRAQYAGTANLDARIALHARFSTHPQNWYEWLAERLELERHTRVLDVGCGPAGLWGQLRAGPNVDSQRVLCDRSAGMLRAARENLHGAPGASTFLQADMGALPLPSQRFDAILANHTLYYAGDLDAVLSELCRLLVPGGYFFASTNGRAARRELDALLRLVRSVPDPHPHTLAFGLEGGREAVARHFEEVRVERYPNHLEADDPDAVVAYVASMEDGQDLSADERAFLRERVASEIAERGHFYVTGDTGLISARGVKAAAA